MGDVNADLQNVIDQCTSFTASASPRPDEIDDLRATVDNACEFSLSGSIVPASLAQDLLLVEQAYRTVSNVVAQLSEAKIVRTKIAEMVEAAAIRASAQSSQDKRKAEAEYIVGKFGMDAVRFEALLKYCEKKLDAVQMRYYTLRAALTSIEQDLRIGSVAGAGTRQLVDGAGAPQKSGLATPADSEGKVGWGAI